MSQHYFETHGGGDYNDFDEDEEARLYNGGLHGDVDPDGFDEHEEAQTRLEYGHLYDEEASEGAFDSDDESRDHNDFLDDEASEAESDAESEQFDGIYTAIFPDTMHSFMRLPTELREMIWKEFCPELSNNPRVFEIIFDASHPPTFAAQVEYQTQPLRMVLAVHQESRKLGQKFAPHLIQLPKDRGVAPCHMERDIVLVDWGFDHRYSPGKDELDMLTRVAPGLQNLAVPVGVTFFDGGPDLDSLYSLRNIFVIQESDLIPAIGLTWCLSGNTQSYHVVHLEDKGNGLFEDLDLLFYWPDPEKHGETGERSFSSRSFGSLQLDEEGHAVNDEGERIPGDSSRSHSMSNWGYEIARLREFLDPLHEMNQTSAQHSRSGSSEAEDGGEQNSEPAQEDHEDHKDRHETEEPSPLPKPQRISVWPLARFEFPDQVRRLEAMRAWNQPWEEWESDGESDNFEEDWDEDDDQDSLDGFIAPDEPFDSEVDDDDGESSIDEELGADAPDHSAQDQNLDVESAEEDDSATEPGDSPIGLHNHEAVIDLVDSSDQGGAEAEENEEEEEDQDGEDVITSSRAVGSSNRRGRGRHIPLDSEDEGVDDDDDDAPKPTRTGGRRVAIPSSESEDNDNEDDTAENHIGGPSVEDDEESSSEEEEDDSEEDMPAPPPKMSLARRLRLEAAQARAALAADDSDDEDQDGEASDNEEDALDGEEEGMGLADEDEHDDDEERW